MKKSEMMARLRKERKDKGLVELRLWLTPEQKERVLKYLTVKKLEIIVASRHCYSMMTTSTKETDK